MSTLLDGMTKALAILAAHDVTPGSFEVTRDVFRECGVQVEYVEINHGNS